VVVHPTCNRKVAGSNPAAGFNPKPPNAVWVQDDSLSLLEFDRKRAIAFLDEGKAVIPVWLDEIYQNLALNLGKN
jgi:hypothetical protein